MDGPADRITNQMESEFLGKQTVGLAAGFCPRSRYAKKDDSEIRSKLLEDLHVMGVWTVVSVSQPTGGRKVYEFLLEGFDRSGNSVEVTGRMVRVGALICPPGAPIMVAIK